VPLWWLSRHLAPRVSEADVVLLIRAADVARACSMPEAIDAVAEGFAALSDGRATVPVRASVPLRDGAVALAMPASLAGGPYYSVKVVTVASGNATRGLPAVLASVALGDAATGTLLALIDGTSLTALRTGAGGGVAARALARKDASVLALFGAGVQARTQLLAAAAVRKLRDARVVGRDAGRVARFVEWARGEASLAGVAVGASDAGAALAGADIVVTATSSSTPVFDGRGLGQGVHVTAVGAFTPEMRELDDATLRGARIFVDERAAALAEAGELRGLTSGDVVEIGEVLAGTAPGRRSQDERTLFKSVGNAIQDLVVASRVYERARELGLGEDVPFP